MWWLCSVNTKPIEDRKPETIELNYIESNVVVLLLNNLPASHQSGVSTPDVVVTDIAKPQEAQAWLGCVFVFLHA